jgi:hypothetical protein
VAGEPVAIPRPHGHVYLHPRLGRIGDIFCPDLLKNLFGTSSLSTIFRMHGDENVAFLASAVRVEAIPNHCSSTGALVRRVLHPGLLDLLERHATPQVWGFMGM